MELEVGISERITVGERFDSVLKLLYVEPRPLAFNYHRFQDFHVQEIDETGTVLELDELILRADISEELKVSDVFTFLCIFFRIATRPRTPVILRSDLALSSLITKLVK